MLSAEFIPSKSETGKFVSALVSTCFYVCLLVGWVGGLSSWLVGFVGLVWCFGLFACLLVCLLVGCLAGSICWLVGLSVCLCVCHSSAHQIFCHILSSSALYKPSGTAEYHHSCAPSFKRNWHILIPCSNACRPVGQNTGLCCSMNCIWCGCMLCIWCGCMLCSCIWCCGMLCICCICMPCMWAASKTRAPEKGLKTCTRCYQGNIVFSACQEVLGALKQS